jgi:hypothetical protein
MREFFCLLVLLFALPSVAKPQTSTLSTSLEHTSSASLGSSTVSEPDNGKTGMVAGTSEGIRFVSSSGNDSNDGLSWVTAKATLTGALLALGTCSTHDVKGRSFVMRCDTVNVGAGRFAIPDGGITIKSPGASIRGQGPGVTRFTYSGTGAAITENQYPGTTTAGDTPGGLLAGFSIDGSGNTNKNTDGLVYEDLSEIQLSDVMISNFTAAGDACLHGDSGKHWDERVDMWAVWLGNCTVGWKLTNSSSDATTLGYGDYDLYINVESGQTGVVSVGNGKSAPLEVQYGLFHVVENLDTPSSSCMKLANYSQWSDNSGSWRCDGNGSSAFTIDAHSYFSFTGPVIADIGSSVAPGGYWWAAYVGHPGSDFSFQINTQGGDAQFSQPAGNHVYSWPRKNGTFPVGAGKGQGNGLCAKWDDQWTLGASDLGTCAVETGSSDRLDILNVAALTGNRTTKVPDANTVLPQPRACAPGQFVDALSGTTGLLRCTSLNLVASGQLTTSAATSDSLTMIGLTSRSRCAFAAENSSAAANIAGSYVSAVGANSVTLTHNRTAGMVYDFVCTVN